MRLEIQELRVEFGPVVAVDDLKLDIASGELVAIVGPSGCGKTTTLSFVAGFTKAKTGRLLFDGADVTRLPPQRRNLGFVFQDYALYPHLSVDENIRFPLDLARVSRPDARRRIAEIAELLDVATLLARRPHQLSGGQRQRVALARALVKNPVVLLLDEPLSNLDAHLRSQMRAEIRRIQLDVGITTLFVTHDQAEALSVADRVAIMNAGRLETLATPRDVYARPPSVFAARFIGTPQMNLWTLGTPEAGFAAAQGVDRLAGARPTVAGIRPEHLTLDPRGVPGRVVLWETLGRDTLLHVDAAGSRVQALVPSMDAMQISPGDQVTLGASADHWHFFDAATGLRLQAGTPKPRARAGVAHDGGDDGRE